MLLTTNADTNQPTIQPTDWVRPDDAYLAIEPLVQAWTRLLRSEAWAQAEAVMEIGKLIFGEEDFMEEVVEKIKASP